MHGNCVSMATSTSTAGIHASSNGEIHEPALGVHVLTEFVFCPRAGLCAYETGGNETEETPPLSFFAISPMYSLAELEAALNQTINELRWFMIIAAITSVLGLILAEFLHLWVGLSSLIVTAYFLILAAVRGFLAYRLHRQLREARAASAKEPDPNTTEIQNVYWWNLFAAGFESQPAQDRLIDPKLNLSGRPTRFLRRGSTVIPVWRMIHYVGQIHEQTLIRMAAYCHLVRTSFGEGVQCPYGVILFGFGHDGVAVPATVENHARFEQALATAREVLQRARQRIDPQPPDSHLCRRCPIGRPKPHQHNVTEHVCNGKSLLVIAATDADGKNHHSLCGDRFRWLPPHELVEQKDLRLQR